MFIRLFVRLSICLFVCLFVSLYQCLFVCLYVCSFVCSGLSDSKSDFYGDMHERAIETKTLGLDSRHKNLSLNQSSLKNLRHKIEKLFEFVIKDEYGVPLVGMTVPDD